MACLVLARELRAHPRHTPVFGSIINAGIDEVQPTRQRAHHFHKENEHGSEADFA
jgi:hypothetical protein